MNKNTIRDALAAASRAPSVLNTQPWRFVEETDDKGDVVALTVRADRSRHLPVSDASGRELTVSCGAVIEFLRLALLAGGAECFLDLLPQPSDPDLFARLRLGGPHEPDKDEVLLAGAIPSRYTERGAFDDRPVAQATRDALQHIVAGCGAWVSFVDTATDELNLAALLARADDLERMNPEYEMELAKWVHPDDDSSDGVPLSALAEDVEGRGSSYRLRDFAATNEHFATRYGPEPPPAERPLVAVIGTESDDTPAWLEAGRALARLLLRAAADGITASPMTQVIEVTSTRARLADSLSFTGHPQVVVRMGYGHGAPKTPRRPVSETLGS